MKLKKEKRIACLYFINICCDILVYEDVFIFFLEFVQLLSYQNILLLFIHKATDLNPSRFITYAPSFILGKLCLE